MKVKNGKLTKNAQKLRTGMTKEEKQLWYDYLKKLSVTFNRQKVIGRYIVDFYCAAAGLVIELDGAQHYEDGAPEADAERDAYMKSLGLTVLRYTNADLHGNFEGICADIEAHLTRAGLVVYGPDELPE